MKKTENILKNKHLMIDILWFKLNFYDIMFRKYKKLQFFKFKKIALRTGHFC